MSIAAFEYINALMQGMGIPYEFMRWQNQLPDDYFFVGEYIEVPSLTKEENGMQEITFILRGYTRKSWLLLEQARELIEKNCARTAILPNGNGIAVFYDSASVVQTGEAELKSIKINLNIQEWKVN